MTNMNFEEYCEDILDQHTGLMSQADLAAARKSFETITKARKSLSGKAMTARNAAKSFGGKALKGTAKQKEWAEKIRAEKLQAMTEKQAMMACDPAGLLTNSKFWIDNRATPAADIADFIEIQKQTLKAYRAAAAAHNTAEAAKLASEYNALTTRWGF